MPDRHSPRVQEGTRIWALLRRFVQWPSALYLRFRAAAWDLGIVRGTWARRTLWQHHAWYWRARRQQALTLFVGRRWWFVRRRNARERALRRSAGWQIFRSTLGSSAAALGLVILLTLADRAAKIANAWLDARVRRGPQRDTGLLRWAIVLRHVLQQDRGFDWAALAGLLGTTAQIAGIFLGLYFATLSALASTSYRDVPAGLREVVIEERAGTVYLKIVAFTGALALYQLGMVAVGLDPGELNAIAVVLLSGFSILSFVLLGKRAFSFFDPSAVANQIIARLSHNWRDVSTGGLLWRDRSFQTFVHRDAVRNAELLGMLEEVTEGTPHPAAALSAIGIRCVSALRDYLETKPGIPLASGWFERRQRHPSWLTAGHAALQFALRSHGHLPPKEEPDTLWMERRLLGIAVHSAEELLKRGEFEEAYSVLDALQRLSDQAAARFDTETSEFVLSHLEPFLAAAAKGAIDAEGARAPSDELHRLAAVDLLSAGPASAIAMFGNAAAALTADIVRLAAIEHAVEAEGAPLGASQPSEVRSQIEFFRVAIAFEKDAEGARITPDWFVVEHCARAWGRALVSGFDALTHRAEHAYCEVLTGLASAGGVPEVILGIQRGQEAGQKLLYHGDVVAATVARLGSLASEGAEAPWPEFSRDATRRRAHALDDAMLRLLADVAPRIDAGIPKGELPDNFGYAYTTLGHSAFRALLEADRDLFRDLFLSFLRLCLRAYDRALAETEQQSAEARLIFSADVLLDALELSGYAYLDNALFGGDAWKVVVSEWERLLKQHQDPAALIAAMAREDELRSNAFRMSARDVLRTSWAQQFAQRIRNEGLAPTGWHWSERDVSAIPTDPIAATYAQNLDLGEHARDVFAVAFLAVHAARGETKLSSAARRFAAEVERTRDRRQRTGGEN